MVLDDIRLEVLVALADLERLVLICLLSGNSLLKGRVHEQVCPVHIILDLPHGVLRNKQALLLEVIIKVIAFVLSRQFFINLIHV